MNNSFIIFIGGIHGAGKGFYSKEICSMLRAEYLSASKLIKWEELNEDAKNKRVDNIPNMQERLLNQLSIICEKNKVYLLDGHYSLLNSDLVPTIVDISVFEAISPKVVLLVGANPKEIQQRLEVRDGRVYELKLIKQMQELEIIHAINISKKLKVPYFRINNNNRAVVIENIKRLI